MIASGYPHLEEVYRVAEILFPKLNLRHDTGDGLPRSHVNPSFSARRLSSPTATRPSARRLDRTDVYCVFRNIVISLFIIALLSWRRALIDVC
jgi:hypothetical protein